MLRLVPHLRGTCVNVLPQHPRPSEKNGLCSGYVDNYLSFKCLPVYLLSCRCIYYLASIVLNQCHLPYPLITDLHPC